MPASTFSGPGFRWPDRFADHAGQPTNAVYGFARFLCELIEESGAKHIAVAFDESLTSSFRNEIYPDYKANREPAPEELRRQFAWCKDLARHAGLPVYSDKRFEADDLDRDPGRQLSPRGSVLLR